MRRRSAFHILLLVFALLFAQQAGVAHSFAHVDASAPTGHDDSKQVPHQQLCDKCVAYAGLSGMAGGSRAVPFVAADHVALTDPVGGIIAIRRYCAFLTRAPPVRLS